MGHAPEVGYAHAEYDNWPTARLQFNDFQRLGHVPHSYTPSSLRPHGCGPFTAPSMMLQFLVRNAAHTARLHTPSVPVQPLHEHCVSKQHENSLESYKTFTQSSNVQPHSSLHISRDLASTAISPSMSFIS